MLSGCGGGGGAGTSPAGAPHISSISPTFVVAGELGFTLTVNGSSFVPDDTVRWNEATVGPTTYVNSSQLKLAVPAAQIANPNDAVTIIVSNSIVQSNVVAFSVPSAFEVQVAACLQSVPKILSVSPPKVTVGQAFTLTVNGSNFCSLDGITFDNLVNIDTTLPTTFVSSSELTAMVPAIAYPAANASVTAGFDYCPINGNCEGNLSPVPFLFSDRGTCTAGWS